jgi:hypothetical protein
MNIGSRFTLSFIEAFLEINVIFSEMDDGGARSAVFF